MGLLGGSSLQIGGLLGFELPAWSRKEPRNGVELRESVALVVRGVTTRWPLSSLPRGTRSSRAPFRGASLTARP